MVGKREINIPIRGDAKDLERAFAQAGTSAEQFRSKVERLNQLKVDKKVLQIDSNVANVEKDIAGLSNSAGGLGAKLKGALSGLSKEFTPTVAGLDGVSSSMSGGAAAAGVMAIGVGALALGVKASVTAFVDHATAISKFAQITQTSAKDASDMVNALDDVGVSADVASNVFVKFTKNLDSKAFSKYGVEIAKTANGNTDMVQTFDNLLRRLDHTTDATERAHISAAAFGKSWAELTPILDRGSAAFEKSLSANVGIRMSDKDLANAKEFKLSMDGLGDAIKQVEFAAARIAMPWIVTATKDLTKLIEGLSTAYGWLDKLPQAAGYHLNLNPMMFVNPGSVIQKNSLKMTVPEMSDRGAEPFRLQMNQMKDATDAVINKHESAYLAESIKNWKSAIEIRLDLMKVQDKQAASAKTMHDAQLRLSSDAVDGARRVKDAEQSLADVRSRAHDLAVGVADAQSGLTKARKDEAKAVQDEKDATAAFEIVAHGSSETSKELTTATKDLTKARMASEASIKRVAELEAQITKTRAEVAVTGPRDADRAARDVIKSQFGVIDATKKVGQTELELNQMRNWGKATALEIAEKERELVLAHFALTEAQITEAESQQTATQKRKEAADPASALKKLEDELKVAKETSALKSEELATKESHVDELRHGYAKTTDTYKTAEQKVADAHDNVANGADRVTKAEEAVAKARIAQAKLPGEIAKAEETLAGIRAKNVTQHLADIETVNAALRGQQELLLQNSIDLQKASKFGNTSSAVYSGGGRPGSGVGSASGSYTGGGKPNLSGGVGAALGTVGAVLANARAALGVNEADGSSSAWLHIDTKITAWCQAAVNKIFEEAGVKLANGGSLSTRESFDKLVSAGFGSSGPVVGGLAYKKRGPGTGHVGIVESYDPSTGMVTTIEGNSGDKEIRHTAKASSWDLGFIDPMRKGGGSPTGGGRGFSVGGFGGGVDETVSVPRIADNTKEAVTVARNAKVEAASNSERLHGAVKSVTDAVSANGSMAGEAARNGSASIVAGLTGLGQSLDVAIGNVLFGASSPVTGGAPAPTRRPDENLDDFRKRIGPKADPAEIGSPGEGWYWDGSAWVKYNSDTGLYDRVDDPVRRLRENPVAGARANGGPVAAGRTYMVGERGPEMVTFGAPGFVTPNGGSGGGGVSVTVHVGGSVTSERDLATAISEGMKDMWRRNGNLRSDGTLVLGR